MGVTDANNDCGDGDYSMGSVCLSGAMRGHVVGEYRSSGN
jgi:hypothetical protein